MKKLTSILSAAMLLAACGQAEDPADPYRKALPTSETLTIKTSGADASTSGTGLVGKSAVGGKSEFAAASYGFASGVNGGVAAMLRLIHAITWWPATSCDDDACTWGPGSNDEDLNVFKLEVTKAGSDDFDFVFSAAPKSTGGTAFLPIVVGQVHRGSHAHRGQGQFSVKFDNDALLDHPNFPFAWQQTEFGTLDVRYDNRSELTNEVVWRLAKNGDVVADDPADPPRINVYFDYDANQRDLRIAYETLDAEAKQMSLHTQWQSTGEGRTDAWYQTATDGPYTETECWNGPSDISSENYKQVYDSGDAANYPDVGSCTGTESFQVGFPTLPEPLYP